jgi:hypothetical protein
MNERLFTDTQILDKLILKLKDQLEENQRSKLLMDGQNELIQVLLGNLEHQRANTKS